MNTISRTITGTVLVLAGIIISFVAFYIKMFSILIYGIPSIIVGVIILLNKKEDQIEQINYSKIKRKKKR